ncbi:MAG: hypothetical protein DDT19_01143 [Syntrophomonadaceae bacterium]|nr:hypothetical protein [Bacillota bacterium]
MKDITFHYTQESMAQDLISLLPLTYEMRVMDAGSGKNKVWAKNLPCRHIEECEIEDGDNFYERDDNVDWVVGNPPYHESWKFTEKAITLAEKGVAWLLNNQALNSHFTPARLEKLSKLGWYYTKIHIVADKRWFGRYYFVVLGKRKKRCEITWNTKTY